MHYEQWISCGPPLSCMSDVPPHVEVIEVILLGDDTLQKIIAMPRQCSFNLVNLGGLDNASRIWSGLDNALLTW